MDATHELLVRRFAPIRHERAEEDVEMSASTAVDNTAAYHRDNHHFEVVAGLFVCYYKILLMHFGCSLQAENFAQIAVDSSCCCWRGRRYEKSRIDLSFARFELAFELVENCWPSATHDPALEGFAHRCRDHAAEQHNLRGPFLASAI